ncbi:MAG TPA: hypothetical protein VFO83_10200, partial [Aggregicoccus sp.]|nr:hypothetical protein [Aggregicoccus sp.]
GEAAREALSGALLDTRVPLQVRRAVPAVLARFPPTVPVGHVLLEAVENATDGLVRFRALRALGQVRTRAPQLPLETPVLERILERTVEAALQYRDTHQRLLLGLAEWCGCRPGDALAPGGRLLATLLAEKARLAGERTFRLLALLHPEEDVRGIYQGLAHADPRVRAGSRELLEALTRPPLRGALLSLALPEAAEEPELEAQAARYRGVVSAVDHPGLVEALLASRSAAVKSLAAYHAAELGLQRLRPQLEALRDGNPGRELGQVVTSALRILESPRGPESDTAGPREQGAGDGR